MQHCAATGMDRESIGQLAQIKTAAIQELYYKQGIWTRPGMRLRNIHLMLCIDVFCPALVLLG